MFDDVVLEERQNFSVEMFLMAFGLGWHEVVVNG